MPPTITVIVPAFNVERYIRDALDSLMGQTRPFFEIIVVDDGSTDATPRILEEYERRGTIRCLHTPNMGPGPARNLGLAQATGTFVYFFDADDALDLRFVETVQDLIDGTPGTEIVSFSGSVFFDGAPEAAFTPAYTRSFSGTFHSGIEATKALIASGSFFTSSCLYVSKRATWTAHHLTFPAIIHEDEVVAFKIACLSGTSLVVDAALFQRRVREGSIMTSRKTMRHVDGYRQACLLTAEFIRDRNLLHSALRTPSRDRLNTLCMAYIETCRALAIHPSVSFVLATYRIAGVRPSLRNLTHLLAPASLINWLKGARRRLS